MSDDIPKLPFLPDAHHYAIAAVAARAAQLDITIKVVVKSLLGHNNRPETARFLLSGGTLSADRVIGLLRSLLRDEFLPGEADAAAIDDLIAQIKRARTERNIIMHWLWGKSDAPGTATLVKVSFVDDEHQFKEKTAAEIQAVAEDLLHAIASLNSWNERIFERMQRAWVAAAQATASAVFDASQPAFGPGLLADPLDDLEEC